MRTNGILRQGVLLGALLAGCSSDKGNDPPTGDQADDFTCPAWTTSATPYAYAATTDWGGDVQKESWGSPPAWSGAASITGLQSSACTWAKVCKDDGSDPDTCYSRCPVAMGIALAESNWNPMTCGGVGTDRGLWQINASAWPDAVPPETGCLSIDLNNTGPQISDIATCAPFNPLLLGAWVVSDGVTQNGMTFNPPGKCWASCGGSACAAGAAGWASGWVPSFLNATPGSGGQGVATSAVTQAICLEAVQQVAGYAVPSWLSPDNCEL